MNEPSSTENGSICNCTKDGTFGLLCEYELITEKNSFEKTIEYQFALKSQHRLGYQIYGNITCYKTSFTCDYGLLCLDWRNICDGMNIFHVISVKQKNSSYIIFQVNNNV